MQHGIISPDLAAIFNAPDENIPQGRKRPLRIQSKARVMTSDEVVKDLEQQKKNLEEKQKKKTAICSAGKFLQTEKKNITYYKCEYRWSRTTTVHIRCKIETKKDSKAHFRRQ